VSRSLARPRRVGFLGFGGSPAPNLNLPGPWNSTSAQDRWGQIYNQIQAEGAQQGISPSQIQDQIGQAQEQFTSTLNGMVNGDTAGPAIANSIASLTGQPLSLMKGIQSGQIGSAFEAMAAATQNSVLANNTVYGAVQICQGAISSYQELAQGISTGNPAEIEAALQTFTGVVVATLIATGAVTAGAGAALGAAVGAAIEIGVSVLNAFHLIGSGSGTKVGDGTCSGQGFTSSQGTTGGVIALPALTWGILSPGANGEGVCVWGSLVSPGSSIWRSFPNPNNPVDANWFDVVEESTIYWPPGLGQAKWYCKNNGNWRMIDNAFHRYRWLESEAQLGYLLANGGGEGVSLAALDPDTGAAVVGFLQAYFRLWKKNAELALNGLTPASDAQVLANLAASWNAAHAPGKTFTFKPYSACVNSYNCFPPGSNGQGTDPGEVTGGYSYASLLVSDLANMGVATVSNATTVTTPNGLNVSGGLVINTGPQLQPPMALTTPGGWTAGKIALATAGALGLGAAGAAGYGLASGQGAGYLFGVGADAAKDLYGRYAGESRRRRKR
jgi:hypothetical protein